SQAKILRAEAADHATAATEGGPAAAPILLHPDWQQEPGTAVADGIGTARKKHARKEADVKAKRILMQKAVLRRQLDVGHADAGWIAGRIVEAGRKHGGHLEIRGRTVIEIDAGHAARSASRRGSQIERVNLEMGIVRGLGIIRDVGRSRQSGLREGA